MNDQAIIFKTCTKCKSSKILLDFNKDSSKKDFLRPCCKICDIKQAKIYRQKNKNKINNYFHTLRQTNKYKQYIKFYQKQYYMLNKEEIKKRTNKYRIQNLQRYAEYNSNWRKDKNNKNKIKLYRIKYYKKHYLYKIDKLLTDPCFKLQNILRQRLNKAIKNNYKSGSAVRDLGCSIEQLKSHLESKFYNRKDGTAMNWNNYGLKGWHIDHIVPLSKFDLTDRNQFLQACHYTNLQPLWSEDNLSKGKNL